MQKQKQDIEELVKKKDNASPYHTSIAQEIAPKKYQNFIKNKKYYFFTVTYIMVILNIFLALRKC